MPIQKITYYTHILVTAPKIDTDLLWMLTMVFIGLAVIYIVSIFFFRNKIASRSSRTKQRKKELSPMISEFLFHEDDADKSEKSHYIDLKIQIRELLKTDFNRKVLTEILLDLRKDVSGDTQKRLFKLYLDLGLEIDAFEKLNSWRWEIISKGISELTRMNVESAYGFITKFINHRRGTIRKQAEIATVTLKPEGINYFLDSTRYKMSEWQQLKLLDVIRNQEDSDPPRFKMWLTSNNIHVVLFALRLIKYYNQNDANSSLIELVKHKNNQIKEEAISCIKEFHVVKALPTLKKIFPKCNTDIKIAILGAIGGLGETSDISFLRHASQRESNFSVKSKALAAINIIAPETIMPTKGIQEIGDFPQTTLYPEEELNKTTNSHSKVIPVGDRQINNGENTEELIFNEDGIRDEKHLQLSDEEASESTEIEQRTEVFVNEAMETDLDENMPENEHIEPFSINGKMVGNENDKQEEDTLAQNTEPVIESAEPVNEDTVIDIEWQVLEPEAPVVESVALESGKSPPKPLSESQNRNSLYHVFIPVVVANESKPVQTLKKYRPMANSQNSNINPKNIEVDYEEVIDFNPTINQKDKTEFFDITQINFLPIVVDIDYNNLDTGTEKTEEGEARCLMEIEVFYDELHPQPIDNELHDLITEINELDFLPIVTDEEMKSENEAEDDKKPEENSLDAIEGYTLSDFEVNFEETCMRAEEEAPEFDLEDPPIIDCQSMDGEDAMSWLLANNELREIELEFEVVSDYKDYEPIADLIPEPIYYDEHEAYMMGLLDDLEEMGDIREIPLLEELMAVEEKSFIRDRITLLISQFSKFRGSQNSSKNNYKQPADLPAFSVFADLFKSIDTESKLILLDEIVGVGDEKEIIFLDGLLEDPNLKIRQKAQNALQLLIAKVSDAETINGNNKKHEVEELSTRLFDCHVATQQQEKDTTKDEYDHLLNEMDIQPPMDNEIFEIEFELAEVLDKRYSKEILDLPVIATEISPNGASFLFQLYHILKIVSIN